ncbi:MAG: rod shape-determining protein RodA, partial [Bdellovibrionales bacterium]|nr:rod shape-determining protein RodA [Bdellovibrionales bacterium]
KLELAFLTVALILAVSLPVAWTYALKPYQKNRVLNFLNPERDPRGTGYNSIQAKIAIGSGQLLGRGFQQGSQNQLEFLPERHSDFIFCVLSEEYGFIGGFFTLALFLVLLLIILHTAQVSADRGGVLVCVGVTAFIFWHLLINIGMVSGLLPIVGVPLPLLSYGGTSLVTFMASLGIVASVGKGRYMF